VPKNNFCSLPPGLILLWEMIIVIFIFSQITPAVPMPLIKTAALIMSGNNHSVMCSGFIWHRRMEMRILNSWLHWRTFQHKKPDKLYFVSLPLCVYLVWLFLSCCFKRLRSKHIPVSSVLWPAPWLLSVMTDYLPPSLLEACVVVGASSDKLLEVYQVTASKCWGIL